LSPPAEDYTINCIADQVKQVFINISMNAVEAMQPGGGTLSIRVVQPGEDGLVGITLQDTGPGIPPDVQARLFEPFFTTKPSGLGLGLSITYELVQRHHGRITVESQANQGAAFTVWLPVIQQNNSQP
jgi:signal transduction histidine kinase